MDTHEPMKAKYNQYTYPMCITKDTNRKGHVMDVHSDIVGVSFVVKFNDGEVPEYVEPKNLIVTKMPTPCDIWYSHFASWFS